MSLEKSQGGVHGRRPSLRGALYERVLNGQEVVSRWPKKRGKAFRKKVAEQNEFFRQAQWAFKYMDASIQQSFAAAVRGTPLMPRDLFLMAISGRLAWFQLDDGTKVVSVASQRDVSASLDFIAQLPGSMLVRGTEQWGALEAPSTSGLVLTSAAPGEEPTWEPAAGGGGGGTLIASYTTVTGDVSHTFSGIPASYADLVLRIVARTLKAGSDFDEMRVRLNGLSTNIYGVAITQGTQPGGNTFVGGSAQSSMLMGYAAGATSRANNRNYTLARIINYADAVNEKLCRSEFVGRGATSLYGGVVSNSADLQAAVNSVTVLTGSGAAFVPGSVIQLLGTT